MILASSKKLVWLTQEVLGRFIVDMEAKGTSGLVYEPSTDTFSVKKKFEIINKEQLKQLILATPTGILDDENLAKCYQRIKKDIDELVSEGWIIPID